MSDLAGREFARILLIKPSSMGDVVHALPVLEGLRQRYPSARISWLLSTVWTDLLAGHDALDEIIPFDRKRYGRIGRSASATAAFAGFVVDLRRRGFDLAIDLQGLFRSGFLARATGARTRIGLPATREPTRFFYTHTIPIESLEQHAVDRYYRVSRLLGFDDTPVSFPLPVPARERSEVDAMLRERGVDPEHFAVLFTAARWETKVWPAEHFAQLADLLSEQFGLSIVLMGGPGDASIGQSVAADMRSTPALIFDATLKRMVATINAARLVVGNESGPIHVAVALDRPVVTMIGPTSVVRTGPYHRPEAVVRRDLACAPCYLKKLSQCPHHHTCLRELSAEAVFEACREVLRPAKLSAT